MANEIKLQALKEGVESVEVNAVKVAPGDTVAKDQALLEVQADKAALDVPSPVAGRVTEVRVKAGDQLKIGDVYCVIEAGNGEAGAPRKAETPARATEAPRKAEAPRPPEDRRAHPVIPDLPPSSPKTTLPAHPATPVATTADKNVAAGPATPRSDSER